MKIQALCDDYKTGTFRIIVSGDDGGCQALTMLCTVNVTVRYGYSYAQIVVPIFAFPSYKLERYAVHLHNALLSPSLPKSRAQSLGIQ